MPLSAKGEVLKSALTKEYGKEKGERVLYAGANSGTFTGIDSFNDACSSLKDDCTAMMDACEKINRRMDAYCARRADTFAEQPAQTDAFAEQPAQDVRGDTTARVDPPRK
jgi:hypothetical protein